MDMMDKKRRNILSLLGWASVFSLFSAGTAFIFDLTKKKNQQQPLEFNAGSLTDYRLGSITLISHGAGCYLSRLEDGGILAFSKRCSHLGCSINYYIEQKQFVCPCHSSSFDLTGEVINSPASRPLPLFAVRIDNGSVFIDLGQPIKRSSYTKDQLVYPPKG